MDTVRQRRIVLLIATGLTGLLIGAAGGGLMGWYVLRDRLRSLDISPGGQKPISNVAEDTDPQKPRALVRVAQAERKPLQPMKPIIGRLAEVRRATVASEVDGQVVEMPVEEGMPVVAGETILARVDDVWSRLALNRGQSRVRSIQARLENASSELKRLEQLSEGDVISESELDGAKTTVAELEAELDSAQTEVEEADERRIRSVIRAPFDGVIIAKHAELGERLSPGTPVVDIVSRGQIDAQILVPESLIDVVVIDQSVQVQIDPLKETVSGKVVSMTPYGVSASRTFPVRVRLDDLQGRLKVGMSVTAMVATAPEEPALVVSPDAVLDRPDGATVWVAVPNTTSGVDEVHPVPVFVRIRTKDEYAIEPETPAGRTLLVPGADVVIEGAEHLLPGQEVQILAPAIDLLNGSAGSDDPGTARLPDSNPEDGIRGRER